MIAIYEVTYLLVCGNDGLISHTIKKIRDITPQPAQDDDEEGNED